MKADPQAQAAIGGRIRLLRRVSLLKRQSEVERSDHARELGEEPVARQLDEPALVSGEQRPDQIPAHGAPAPQRAGLVLLHQPGIAGDVRHEDDGEPALVTGWCHRLLRPWDGVGASA